MANRADVLAEYAETRNLGEPWFTVLDPALEGHYEYDLINSLAADNILGFCRALAGYSFKIGWSLQLVLNSKGGSWHQDSQFADESRFPADFNMHEWKHEAPFSQLTVRVALVDDPTAWLIPETHLRELTDLEQAAVSVKFESNRTATADTSLPGAINITLGAGDLLMYHRTIMHAGTPIPADEKRRTLYWTWTKADRFDPLHHENLSLSSEQREQVHPDIVTIYDRTP